MNKSTAARQVRIVVDAAQRCLVTGDGKRILLTEAEMSVLEAMLDATGNSVSRDWLSRVALKRPRHAADRAVDQVVMEAPPQTHRSRRLRAHHPQRPPPIRITNLDDTADDTADAL